MRSKCLGVLAGSVLLGAAAAEAAQPPASFADLADRLADTVVNISTTQTVRVPGMGLPPGFAVPPGFEDLFRHFFGPGVPEMEQKRRSLGSGFILSPDGYIATNHHVIENADEIVVRLHDGREFKARLVGSDEKTDIAVLKIKARGLVPAKLGDSDKARVGDWVIAIGNPFGLSFTVTAGIISAKGRVIGAGPYDDFLQTDAAINPGNSGGPLFNMAGEVIGINTAILSRSGGNNGIGFAIPINMARRVIDELKRTGHVTRAYLGVMIGDVSKEEAKALGLGHAQGALVRQVVKGTPADRAGIQPGDVIVEVDGMPVKKAHDLPKRIALRKPGEKVRLVVLRGGRKLVLTATLGKMPEQQQTARASTGGVQLGIEVGALSEEERARLGVGVRHGVVVRRVMRGSLAAQAGIQPGDVIYLVNGERIRSPEDLMRILRNARPGDALRIMLDRHGDKVFVFVVIPKGRPE